MQLVYIWTDKFKGINNFELNLVNNIEVKIEDQELKIFSINDPHPNFYGSHIDSLKLLIGENGTGKSTVLELIKTICCTDENSLLRKSPNPFNALAVFKSENDFLYLKQGSFHLKIDEKIKRLSLTKSQMLDSISFIYYSNTFEYGERHNHEYNLWDISTIGEIKSSKSNFDDINDTHELLGWESIFNQFKNDEIERQINLVCNLNIELPFKLPEKINLNIGELESSYQNYDEDRYDDDKVVHNSPVVIRRFIREFNYMTRNNKKYNEKRHFFYELLQLAIKSYIENKSSMSKEGIYSALPSYKVDEDIIAQIISDLKSVKLKDRFIDFFDAFYSSSDYNQLSYSGTDLYNSLDELHQFLVSKGTVLNNMSAFVYLNTDELRTEFYSTIKPFFQQSFLPSLINFQWNDLSTGEINFLNILSRLYEIKRLNDNKQVFLMIDEGDITLHPEWQRQYISFLIKNLVLIFPGLNYQLLITSHSPIILSDIPNFDIVYMNRDSSLNELKTFGSNIIDLYAKPFIMNHVMGDFAKETIEKLLSELYDSKERCENEKSFISAEKYSSFYNRISIIGDDIIRLRLFEILDLIPKSNKQIEQELEMAKNKVLELEKKLKKL